MYPFAERWATGDERLHHLLDRPRNAATRTAIGAAAVAWYGNLWAAGGNDVLAFVFKLPLLWTTWFFRVGFFAAPVLAFVVTRRICLSLQRRDLRERREGVESGLISLTPEGGFRERHEQPSDEGEALLRTRRPAELVAPYPNHLIPLPTPDRARSQLRTRANRFYMNYQAESYGGGQGDLSRDSRDEEEDGG
jgi:ubiquinol-cytochrome c reductase cytochrome b subunit